MGFSVNKLIKSLTDPLIEFQTAIYVGRRWSQGRIKTP